MMIAPTAEIAIITHTTAFVCWRSVSPVARRPESPPPAGPTAARNAVRTVDRTGARGRSQLHIPRVRTASPTPHQRRQGLRPPGSYKGALNHTHRPAGGHRQSGEGMRPRSHRERVVAVGLAVAIVLTIVSGLGALRPAGAQSTPGSASTSFAVTAANGYAFSPNSFNQVATNSTITVTFTDASVLAHTFTIIGREGWVIPPTITTSAFDNLVFGTSPARLFNLNVSGAGNQLSATFQSPGPGWYEFVCTQGGHFSLGMYGFIAFGMNLPSNLTVSSGLPGPGAAIFIISGTIVSLVVIALVLGFVVGRREGARHEMPPERLGYAEPSASTEPFPPATSQPGHR